MRFIIGIPLVVVGFLMVWKTDWLVSNWGRIEWAEEHLADAGGTRIFYKIGGIIIIFGSYLAMTGLLQEIVTGTFGALFGSV